MGRSETLKVDKMSYRSEIDGLRALAVIPVIFFHAGFDFFSGGFVGVDVFFVISGYLIATIIIEQLEENEFSLIEFYERRARRILPALFFMIAVCVPFAFFWLTPDDLKDFGQSLVAVSTFSSNILFWLESGYFDQAAELKPLLHTWSLAVEEQYYLVFPVFMILVWRLGFLWIVWSLSLIFLISFSLALWGIDKFPVGSFYFLPMRAWELLIGVFAALHLKYIPIYGSTNFKQVVSLVGLGLVIGSILFFDETLPFPSFYTLLPTLGTGLLILYATQSTVAHSILSSVLLVPLGLISYSAYLWHQPLLAFSRHQTLGDPASYIVLAICFLSLIIAWVSWRFVERPFRNKELFSRRVVFGFSFVGLVVFSLIGLRFHLSSGEISRFNEDVFAPERIDITGYHSLNLRRDKCHLNEGETVLPSCDLGALNGSPKLVLIGDSHAYSISGSLAEQFERVGLSFRKYTKNACPPALGGNDLLSTDCVDFNSQVLSALNSEIPDVAVLSARWGYYLSDFYLDQQVVSKNKKRGLDEREAQVRELRIAYISFIDQLERIGIQVIFLGPNPEHPWSVPTQIAKNYLASGVLQATVLPLHEFNKQASPLTPVYAYLNKKNILNVEPSQVLCSTGDGCIGISDHGEALYWDAHHLSVAGSRLVVKKLMTAEPIRALIIDSTKTENLIH